MIVYREQIHFDSVLLNVRASTPEKVFEAIGRETEKLLKISSDVIRDLLIRKEEQMPSGIGNGIALPHIQHERAGKPIGMIIKLEEPVMFEGIDDEPVDVVIFLLSPLKDGAYHLRRLSRLSRLLRNENFCKKVRAENDAEALQDLFVESQRELLIAA